MRECGSDVRFQLFEKAEDFAFVVQPVFAVGNFLFGAPDGVVTEVRRNGERALDGKSAHETAAERGGKHVARAVERAVHMGNGNAAFAFVLIVYKISLVRLRARDHGVGADFCKFFKRGGKILRPREKVALRLVGKNVIRFLAQGEHLVGERLVESLIEGEIVAQHGIDHEHAALFEEPPLDILDEGDLRAAAEVSAVNEVVFQTKRLPMVGDFLHFVVEVEEGVPCESARMGGEERGGENVAGQTARRHDGQRYGQGAFSDTGDIVDCKNAHKKPRFVSF